MPSELETAKNALAEVERELNRIDSELDDLKGERSNVVRQIAAVGRHADIDELTDLLDRSQDLARTIDGLSEQKRQRRAEWKQAREQAKEVELKVGHLRQTIRAAEERLAPGGELERRLREAEHAVELQIRLRESIERELLRLRRQLQQLVGSVG